MSLRDEFFVGWAGPSRPLARLLLGLGALLVALFAWLGWLLAAAQGDPGEGGFRFDLGRQSVAGVVTLEPYPVLHVTESARWGAGTALLLSNPGKYGVQGRLADLGGRLVRLEGIELARGDLSMLQLTGRAEGVEPLAGPAPAVPRHDLGRWRLTGEICDGKCYAGAMRPGRGIAHKACANICLAGGVPPVLVTTAPVEGHRFLLIAGPEGGPMPPGLADRTGELLTMEGRVERVGGLLVFRADPGSAERAE